MPKRSAGGKVLRVEGSLIDLTALKASLRSAYEGETEKRLEDAVDEVTKYAKELLEKTTENWVGGGRYSDVVSRYTGVQYEKPVFSVETKREGPFQVTVNIWTDNTLWNWLDQGTSAYSSSKPMHFLPFDETRTIPGTLEVKDAPVIASEWVSTYMRKGIEPRNWTGIVIDHVNAEYGGLSLKVFARKR